MARNVSSVRTLYEDSDPWVFKDPPRYLPFEFEKSVDVNESRIWADEQLPLVGALCVLYFILISVGPSYMKNRKPYDLQKPLAIWNFALAVFSIMGTIRIAPVVLDILLQPNGFHTSLCERKGITQPLVFWRFAFAVSKIVEFGDSAFIVLRKKPLIFLHWFHHLTMGYFCIVAIKESEPIFSMNSLTNFTIHSLMYSYFTLMALRFKISKKVSMLITTLQIIQFFFMLYINLYTMRALLLGENCARSWSSLAAQTIIGTIYLSLFIKLFYQSYIVKQKKKSS